MHRATTIAALVGATTLALTASVVQAATVLVAVHGVDSGACGTKTAPCRTITRAIANAGVDDTVVVGPGRYGDVDGSGTISGPQEEQPNVNGCGCVLEIGKRLTVVSRDGAAATVIDGGTNGHTVRLSADGGVFGKKNKGFTVTGGDISKGGLDIVANDTAVAGHVFVANKSDGITLEGSRNLITASRCFANVTGLYVTGSDNMIAEVAVVGDSADGTGFSIGGNRNTLKGVVAIGNEIGIALGGTGHVVTGSVATANSFAGIDVGGAATTITKTNLVGNGTGFLGANCGLITSEDGISIVATGNYWGATSGPGADPADNVCVNNQNATAVTTPFATKELKTPTKPLR